VTNSRPLLLDASVLVAYERELTRRAQAFVVQAITDGRILVASALSVAVAAAELADQHRELSWLVEDSEGPLQVLSLSSMNALDCRHARRSGRRAGRRHSGAGPGRVRGCWYPCHRADARAQALSGTVG
jgi:hypothetical protein